MVRWIISCKEHARLSSKSMDHSLTLWERLHVRIHQWICPPCSRIGDQFSAIRKACRYSTEDLDTSNGTDQPILSHDACQRIKSALRKQMKG